MLPYGWPLCKVWGEVNISKKTNRQKAKKEILSELTEDNYNHELEYQERVALGYFGY